MATTLLDDEGRSAVVLRVPFNSKVLSSPNPFLSRRGSNEIKTHELFTQLLYYFFQYLLESVHFLSTNRVCFCSGNIPSKICLAI